MNPLTHTVLSLCLLAVSPLRVSQAQTVLADATVPDAPSVTIAHRGSQAPQAGPADRFTGQVNVTRLFGAQAPSRVSAGSVTFAPGARSAWHTHPLGQVLLVTAGTGWI